MDYLKVKKVVFKVRAKSLGVYDALNKIMVNSNIDPYNVSEKEQILKLIDEIVDFYKNEKILMIFDRGYFGIDFIDILEEKGIKYLIRMREKFYKKEKDEMESDDEEVKLKIRNNSVFYASEERRKKLKEKKYVKTRIIKVKIKETEEHLSTNLKPEEITKEEAKDLYFVRWNIEKAFDVIKNKINIENFSSKKVIGVEQEFYAQIMVYNMLEDINREMKIEDKKGLKYKYKANMNILAGIFKDEFVNVLLSPTAEESLIKYKNMIEHMKKYVVPIKPNRTFPRRKMHSMNKYRSNLRRNI